MSASTVHRFLFEHLAIRGAVVRLGDCWQAMQEDRTYPAPVAALLGEMAAVTALIAGQLKQPGRLSFQLRSSGAIRLLVVDCNESLQMRGMAKMADVAPAGKSSAAELLAEARGGQLVLSLEMDGARQPYQSVVPLEGESVAAIFEHYLEQSEQQASRLFLATDAGHAACLFLQKLPEADEADADGWNRVQQLASTASHEELCTLDAEALLIRLFHEEPLRLFEPHVVRYHCPYDREKIRGAVAALGREEAESILEEFGEIVIKDELCNHEYRFSAAEVAEIFDGHVVH